MSTNLKEAVKLLAFAAAMAAFAAVSPVGMNLIAFAVVLSFLVVIHELGHYIWFKRAGVKIDEFAIGMGPAIATFQFGSEKWSFRALLIGGFVRPVDDKVATPWGRMKAVLAGPLVNIAFAFVALFVALMLPTNNKVEVELVVDDSPAYVAGVEVFDDIIAINGIAVATGDDYRAALPADTSQPVAFTIQKDNGTVITVTMVANAEGNYGFAASHIRSGGPGMGVVDAATTSSKALVTSVPRFFVAIKSMIVGDAAESAPTGAKPEAEADAPKAGMAGPNKFGEILREQSQGGLFAVLTLLASLSLVLGISNLIPLLPLDGGHVVTTAFEMLGKPIPEKIQNVASMLVAIPLFGLTIVWLFWDIIEKFL